MIRATTPTHKFTLPFETDRIKSLLISYSQNDKEVLDKRKDDCTLEGKEIQVKLSQEETKLFCGELPVEIQLRILTVTDDSIASKKYEVPCEDVTNDEVLK